MNILDFAVSQGWAMLPERAEELVTIAVRAHEATPQTLEAYRSKTLEKAERATARNGVAILDVSGPLFKKANLLVEMSGATSYEILRRDLQAALDNPAIHSILLVVDSPGGEANGCDELAAAIYDARSKKPVTAFVSGLAASGGYWIASAASKIVISDAALLGSIGVVLGIQDKRAADEKRGVKNIEFVSAVSPGKRPDPSTDEGKNRIQAMVDDLAEVFVAAVAKYRGVSVDDVLKNFGAGGLKVGAKAVASGMADEVGQLEATILSMIKSGDKGRFNPNRSAGGFSMSDTTNGPTVDENAVKARIKGITASEDGKAFPTLAGHLAFDTNVSVEEAGKIIAAAKADMPKIDQSQLAPAVITPTAPEGSKAEFASRKESAGALGASEPVGGKASSFDPFARAVANHNKNFA